MKKILLLALIAFVAAPSFAAVDTWFNTNPYKKYDESINLDKVFSDTYDKDGIKIEKDIGELEVNERKYSGNQEFGQGDENIINIEGSIGNIDIEY